MSTAHALRRRADVERLHSLAARSKGRLEIDAADPQPGEPIRLTLRLRTVTSSTWRSATAASGTVRLRINLPARYPFERPVVVVETPIFHPNVFPNGTVCQGEKWIQTEGLDLLVMRIVRLLTWHPTHVNPSSPANRTAANWYLQQLEGQASDGAPHRSSPRSSPCSSPLSSPFPTETLDWDPERVVVPCPACGKGLRLPVGRRGVVNCPACHTDVEVQS